MELIPSKYGLPFRNYNFRKNNGFKRKKNTNNNKNITKQNTNRKTSKQTNKTTDNKPISSSHTPNC